MADDHMRKAVDRMTRKTGPGLYSDNHTGTNKSNCRAPVRIYIGQGRMGGSWIQCSKRKRPGCQTCWWHRAHEEE